ncbi:MAG: S-layer homology domain-containing protein [Defluviitaleaceae bacterium]|nr:S-layer homology domain-containing protein [Defluviitaleaceae bacterium]
MIRKKLRGFCWLLVILLVLAPMGVFANEEETFTISPSVVSISNNNLSGTVAVGGTATGAITFDRGNLPAEIELSASDDGITVTGRSLAAGASDIDENFTVYATRQGIRVGFEVAVHLTASATFPISFETSSASQNGLVATGSIAPEGEQVAGTSITVTVTLTGTATAAGTHTVGLTGASSITPPSAVTRVVAVGEAASAGASTFAFTFVMPAAAVSDLVVVHTFAATITTPTAPVIAQPNLPVGTVGAAYNYAFSATGSTPITWAIASGNLPAGLSLDTATGVISGTPTSQGTTNFTVSATNSVGENTRALSIQISAQATTGVPSVTTTSLPTATINMEYSQFLQATGTAPMTWAVSGSLPTGLTLNANTGEVSGTPTQTGNFNFTVIATNDLGNNSAAISLTVDSASTWANRPALDPPWSVWISGDTVFWDSVSNATNYRIYSGNSVLGTTWGTSFYLRDRISSGNHSIRVRALGDGHSFSDSVLSHSVSFNIQPAWQYWHHWMQTGYTPQVWPPPPQPAVAAPGQADATPPGQGAPVQQVAGVTLPPMQNVPSVLFHDVPTSAWYHPYINVVVSHQLFSGVGSGLFDPHVNMNRAMFAQVLANLEGVQPAQRWPSFLDVPMNAWYFQSIEWAAENGVVAGVGGGNFAPYEYVTREQIAVILHRYAVANDIELPWSAIAPFTDQHQISPWAADSVRVMQVAGVVTGSADGRLGPQVPATRAEVAAVFARFINLIG